MFEVFFLFFLFFFLFLRLQEFFVEFPLLLLLFFFFLLSIVYWFWYGIYFQLYELDKEIFEIHFKCLKLKSLILETNTGLNQSHSLLMLKKKLNFLKFFGTIACVYLILVLTVSYNGKGGGNGNIPDLSAFLDSLERFKFNLMMQSRRVLRLENQINDLIEFLSSTQFNLEQLQNLVEQQLSLLSLPTNNVPLFLGTN